jgi:hypothetical protein
VAKSGFGIDKWFGGLRIGPVGNFLFEAAEVGYGDVAGTGGP